MNKLNLISGANPINIGGAAQCIAQASEVKTPNLSRRYLSTNVSGLLKAFPLEDVFKVENILLFTYIDFEKLFT